MSDLGSAPPLKNAEDARAPGCVDFVVLKRDVEIEALEEPGPCALSLREFHDGLFALVEAVEASRAYFVANYSDGVTGDERVNAAFARFDWKFAGVRLRGWRR